MSSKNIKPVLNTGTVYFFYLKELSDSRFLVSINREPIAIHADDDDGQDAIDLTHYYYGILSFKSILSLIKMIYRYSEIEFSNVTEVQFRIEDFL